MLSRSLPLKGSILLVVFSLGAGLKASDCNENGVADRIEILSGQSVDCDGNGVPDDCDLRTNDCNQNGILDRCELLSETSPDCNFNGLPDECDLAAKKSANCNENAIPDECEPDCNRNGAPDDCDFASGAALDCNRNGIPDSCDLLPGSSFAAITSFVAGDRPVFTAGGDLNADGKPDLAVADAGSKAISLLLNAGGGSLIRGKSLELGSRPKALELGDFDGDQVLDLAVSLPDGQAIAVLVNQGDGAFASPSLLALAQEPAALAAADLNGDGDLDLGVAGTESTGLSFTSVLFSRGNGSFKEPLRLRMGLVPTALTAGDFNGDGTVDLAAASLGTFAGFAPTITVFSNRGGESFELKSEVLAAPSPVFLVSEDIDQDSDADLVQISSGQGSADAVWLIENDGAGNFHPASILSPGKLRRPSALARGDWNGDKRTDLAVASRDSDFVSLLWNEGGAVFVQEDLVAGEGPGHLTSADLNGDGLPDLAITHEGSGKLTVIWNRGGGRFEGPRALETGDWVTAGVSGDLDGDGSPDLALVSAEESRPSVALNLGDGTFSSPRRILTSIFPDSIAPIDLNQDGQPDLVAGSQPLNILQVWLNAGRGDFETSAIIDLPVELVTSVGHGPLSLEPVDLDNDGDMDLVAGDPMAGSLVFLAGKGDGTLLAEKTLKLEREYLSPLPVASGDWDGDGVQDLALASYGSPSLQILRNEGGGSFRVEKISASAEVSSPILSTDIDRDGKLDLVTVLFPPVGGGPWLITPFLNKGGGGFVEAAGVPVGPHPPEALAAGDVSSDGLVDVMFSSNHFRGFDHFTGAEVGILPGRKDGKMEGPESSLFLDGAIFGLLPKDLNGDGKLDLAVLSSTVHLLMNQMGAFSKDLDKNGVPDECEASARLASLTLEPNGALGGSSSTVKLTLSSPAPTEGARVGLGTSDPGLARLPESVVVPGGETGATVKIKTSAVERPVHVVIRARKDQIEREAVLTVLPPKFRRGDANQDGSVNLTDAVRILLYLFRGGEMPSCLNAADADDNGRLNMSDPIAILLHLVLGHGPLPEPFSECGWDKGEDLLGCKAFSPCSG
jgi:hypothetical protein